LAAVQQVVAMVVTVVMVVMAAGCAWRSCERVARCLAVAAHAQDAVQDASQARWVVAVSGKPQALHRQPLDIKVKLGASL
jgi:hypothetical protein